MEADEDLLIELKEVRAVLSLERNCFPHMILDENNIEQLMTTRPQDKDSLIDVLGDMKSEQYGDKILEVLDQLEHVVN